MMPVSLQIKKLLLNIRKSDIKLPKSSSERSEVVSTLCSRILVRRNRSTKRYRRRHWSILTHEREASELLKQSCKCILPWYVFPLHLYALANLKGASYHPQYTVRRACWNLLRNTLLDKMTLLWHCVDRKMNGWMDGWMNSQINKTKAAQM